LALEDSLLKRLRPERANFSHVLTIEATIFENFAAREDDAMATGRAACTEGMDFFCQRVGHNALDL
jgi:hypothetical protein